MRGRRRKRKRRSRRWIIRLGLQGGEREFVIDGKDEDENGRGSGGEGMKLEIGEKEMK